MLPLFSPLLPLLITCHLPSPCCLMPAYFMILLTLLIYSCMPFCRHLLRHTPLLPFRQRHYYVSMMLYAAYFRYAFAALRIIMPCLRCCRYADACLFDYAIVLRHYVIARCRYVDDVAAIRYYAAPCLPPHDFAAFFASLRFSPAARRLCHAAVDLRRYD